MDSDLFRQFGERYTVEGELGKGGMGVVYRAVDRLTGAAVALKGVTTALPNSSGHELAMTLAHEFQVLCALRHPYIISVLDYGFDKSGAPYYTMELLSGAQDIVNGAREASLDQRLEYFAQITEALVYLHRHGILHGDLKPANILLANNRVRLVDFGLSIQVEQARAVQGSVTGTLPYIAPEILIGGIKPSKRSDLYSLGVVALELLVGHSVHTQERSAMRVIGPRVDLTDLEQAGLPSGYVEVLQRLILRLTESDPNTRPNDAGQILEQIDQLAGRGSHTKKSAPIRESFLQAAKFVGRTPELRLSSTPLSKRTTSAVAPGYSWAKAASGSRV